MNLSNSQKTAILNNEFNDMARKLETINKNFLPNVDDQIKVKSWTMKLIQYRPTTLQDFKMRSDLMFALVFQCQKGFLESPFKEPVPQTITTAGLKKLMAAVAKPAQPLDILPLNFRRPSWLKHTPDQGAALVGQPFPKCGAWCYLAVISKPPTATLDTSNSQ